MTPPPSWLLARNPGPLVSRPAVRLWLLLARKAKGAPIPMARAQLAFHRRAAP